MRLRRTIKPQGIHFIAMARSGNFLIIRDWRIHSGGFFLSRAMTSISIE